MIVLAKVQLSRPETDKFLVDQGVVLEYKGIAGLSSQSTTIPVFLKVQQPTIEQFDQKCKKICRTDDILELAFNNCTRKMIGTDVVTFHTQKFPNVGKCLELCNTSPRCKAFVYVPAYQDCGLRDEFAESTEARDYSLYEFDMQCINNMKTECVSSEKVLASELSKVLAYNLKLRVNEFWQAKKLQFDDIKLKITGGTGRKKRSAAMALLAVPVLGSILNFGYTFWESHKLSQKIVLMQSKFNEFAAQVHSFEEHTVQWEAEALTLIEKLDEKITTGLSELQCETNILGYNILQSQKITDWKLTINEILKSLDKGSIVGHLSSRIFDEKALHTLVSQVTEIKGTIYEDDPSYLYHTSTMTILEILDNESVYSFHMLLHVPLIPKSQIFPYFEIKQTSFSYKNKCYFHKTPKYVYEVREFYYMLDLNLCEGGFSEILYCYQDLISDKNVNERLKQSACINSNIIEQCELTPTSCMDKVVNVDAGVLIHSNATIKSILKNPVENMKIEEIKPNASSSQVTFYSWDIYEMIEYKNGLIPNPHLTEPIELDILTFEPKKWKKMIKSNHLNLDKLNTSKAVELLEKSVNTIKDGTLIDTSFGWNHTYLSLTLFSATMWILVIACSIISWFWTKIKVDNGALQGKTSCDMEENVELETKKGEQGLPEIITYIQDKNPESGIVELMEENQILRSNLKKRRKQIVNVEGAREDIKNIPDTSEEET